MRNPDSVKRSTREVLEQLAARLGAKIDRLRDSDVDWAEGYVAALRETVNEDIRDLLLEEKA